MQDSYGNQVEAGEYVYCAYSKEALEAPGAALYILKGKNNVFRTDPLNPLSMRQSSNYVTSGGPFPYVRKADTEMNNFRCSDPLDRDSEVSETVEDVVLALRAVNGMLRLFGDGSWDVVDDNTEEVIKGSDELPIVDQLLTPEPEPVTLANGREALVLPRQGGYVGLVQGPEGAYPVYWDEHGWCADEQHQIKGGM